ncbi:MAG: pilus assembly protein PilM, partial [Ruminococcus sp.]|nr:pilus assembly protein PilM [Ruminococcus sp.]
LYANAIGAMFKRNKDTEKINLLDADFSSAVKNRVANESAGNYVMLGTIGAAVLVMAGVWGVLTIKDNGIQDDIQVCQDYIDNPDTAKKIKYLEKLEGIKSKVDTYNVAMTNAHDAFFSQPIINGDKYDLVEETLKSTAEELQLTDVKISIPKYIDGQLSITVDCNYNGGAYQELPAEFVANLLEKDAFDNASYSGYRLNQVIVDKDAEPEIHVRFDVTMRVKGEQSAYHPEETEEDTAE